MKFTKIGIKNFKGIDSLTLDLNRPPNLKVFTLVGLNESGKTSILEAINLLQDSNYSNSKHTLIPKGKKINFNDDIKITGYYSWSDEDNQSLKGFIKTLGYKDVLEIKSHKKSIKYEFKESEFIESLDIWDLDIKVKKNKSTKYFELYDKNKEEWNLVIDFINKNLLPEVIYYPDFLFDFPERIYINDKKYSYGDGRYYEAIEDILHYIEPGLSINKHLLERMKSDKKSSVEALESTLGQMSTTVSRVVFSTWDRIFKKGVKEIVISYSSEPSVDQDINYYLEFKVKEGPVKFHINERSLGFRWFFAFLLFTEFRKLRKKTTGEILFLLDEPASNLHLTAQKKLLTTFAELVSHSTLVYTTHSHHLINPDWLNGVYIVKNKALDYKDNFAFEPTQTDVDVVLYRSFVADHPEQVDYFQPILDTLQYQPGLLEKIPNLVVLEGKNDYYTFKYINKVYFNGKYDSLNFFPGTGATTHKHIVGLYLAWGRNFVIFLDDDKEGRSAKKTYESDFGIDVKDKILTIKDIDSGFSSFATEDLFTEKEKLSLTKRFKADSTTFEKSKFNTTLQTLYQFNESIELDQLTLSNFEKIFEKLIEKF